MTQAQDKNFEQYVEKCKELKRDLEHVLIDLEFTREQGGKIRYAVDFSEIYAYALPSKTASEFSLFEDDSETWIDSLQRLALQRLFDDLTENLILLNPYSIELRRFLRNLGKKQQQAFDVDAKKQAQKVREELQTLRWDPESKYAQEYAQIVELNEKVENEIDLTAEENEKIIDFFAQSETIMLLAFLGWQRDDDFPNIRELFEAYSRLKRLFREQRFEDLEDLFEDLEDLVKVDVSLDSEAALDWCEKIRDQSSRKPQGTALLDGAAIAMVEQANSVLQGEKVKLLLVTRSATMHKLFEHRSSKNSEPYDSPLRHLRTFSVLEVEGIPTESARQQLRDQLEDINEFLEAVEAIEDPAIEEDSGNGTLLTKIKKAWHQTEALKATLASHEKSSEIGHILRLLQTGQNLHKLVIDRLNELTDDLDWEHAQLRWYVLGSDRTVQDFLINHLAAKGVGTTCVLEVVEHPLSKQLPYSLEFYTDEAKRLLDNFARDSKLPSENKPEPKEVRDFFQQGLSMDAEYEPLLIIAYVLGTLTQWELAEKYCERALEIAHKTSDVPLHEGKFFLAICMRRLDPSVARHREAISLLDNAIALKAKLENGAEPDPRYRKEKALHILLLNTDWIEEYDDEFPDPDEALDLLDKAYEGSENDDILRKRIILDRLYYFVETGQIDKHKARVIKEYQELEKFEEEIKLDASKWPIFVIDTMAWMRWNLLDLLGKDNDSEKELIVKQLERVRDRSRGKDRERCQRHLEAVREGKRRENWIDAWSKTSVAEGETPS